jgi:hypothetical protein
MIPMTLATHVKTLFALSRGERYEITLQAINYVAKKYLAANRCPCRVLSRIWTNILPSFVPALEKRLVWLEPTNRVTIQGDRSPRWLVHVKKTHNVNQSRSPRPVPR